jgi:hypothetical protein
LEKALCTPGFQLFCVPPVCRIINERSEKNTMVSGEMFQYMKRAYFIPFIWGVWDTVTEAEKWSFQRVQYQLLTVSR